MAVLPRAAIDEYTRQLDLVSDGMRQRLADELAKVDWSDMEAARRRVLEIMNVYCAAATDSAALLAARFYEDVRALEVGGTYEALVASGRVPEATEDAVYSFFAGKDATPETIVPKLLTRLGYETKRAAGECVFLNGARDKRKPLFARVPSGSDTCQFCLMLAGRGFVYRSAGAAGFLNHYHADCDCRVVPSFKGSTVEGYVPRAVARRWEASVTATAQSRAERRGTSVEEERAKIIQQLEEGASRAKGRQALEAGAEEASI